jgi:hypothetical protein
LHHLLTTESERERRRRRRRRRREHDSNKSMPTMSEPISHQIRKPSSTTEQQTGGNHRFEGGLGGQEKMLRHSRRKREKLMVRTYVDRQPRRGLQASLVSEKVAKPTVEREFTAM